MDGFSRGASFDAYYSQKRSAASLTFAKSTANMAEQVAEALAAAIGGGFSKLALYPMDMCAATHCPLLLSPCFTFASESAQRPFC